MAKLRSIAMAVVAAVALVSGNAYAQDAAQTGSADGGWNTRYGMIFTVQNVFGNGNASTLSDLGGSVGLQYNLSPQRALRLTVNLSRASNSGAETTRTDLVTGQETTTFTAPTGFTSEYDVGLGAAYMMRLGSAAIAPYVGAGGGVGYNQRALQYTDDINSATSTTEVDHMTRTIDLNAQGILGLEWRVHKSVSLFAEYALDFSVVSWSKTANEDTNTSKTTGQLNSGTKVEFSKTTFFNFDTGIGQGGLIGLVAFF